jgi:hypothetical protein
MTEPGFDYPRILQQALRSVVREVLGRTAESGLPGEHHFYLSLRTDHPGIELPAFLRERYPEEITVVLQNQFWDLAVDGDGFAVTLRFDGDLVRLAVPFDAVVAFFDPAAQFGLRFDLAGLGGHVPPRSDVDAGAAAGDAVSDGPGSPVPHPVPVPPPDGDPVDGPSAEAKAEAKVLSFERSRDRRDPE